MKRRLGGIKFFPFNKLNFAAESSRKFPNERVRKLPLYYDISAAHLALSYATMKSLQFVITQPVSLGSLIKKRREL